MPERIDADVKPRKHRAGRALRRVERFLLGLVMSAIALVAERIVVRAVARGEVEPRGKVERRAPGLSVSPDQVGLD